MIEGELLYDVFIDFLESVWEFFFISFVGEVVYYFKVVYMNDEVFYDMFVVDIIYKVNDEYVYV